MRGQVRRPNDVVNASIRVEQALGAGNALRAEYQRRTQDRRNLGVGDFDLPERAYRTDARHRHAAAAQHPRAQQDACSPS